MINFIIIRSLFIITGFTYIYIKKNRTNQVTHPVSPLAVRRFDFYTLRNLMLQVRVSSYFSLAPDLIILHILYIY